MNIEEAIDCLQNCVADYVIGDFCVGKYCPDEDMCKEKDCPYKEAITEVVETELKEEVKKVVIESKQAILDGIKPAFANIGAEIAKGMEEKAIENLKSAWKSEDIYKKLFD